MPSRTWSRLLARLFRNSGVGRPSRTRRPGPTLHLEALEERLAPAFGPLSADQLVNGPPLAGDQINSSVAADADGDFVIAWEGDDAAARGIYARYYNPASGAGIQITVNTTTAGSQTNPEVAMNAAGDFVVVWQGPDGGGDGIFAQRFNASGQRLGAEFRVNVTTAGEQTAASVALDAAGNFVVAWQSPDTDGTGIFHRRFDVAGVARDPVEVQVNIAEGGAQTNPTVTMNARGDYAIAWQGPDAFFDGISARSYLANGTPVSGEIAVNAVVADVQQNPDIAMDGAGNFVVTWESFDEETNGTFGIYARRFALSGTPLALGANAAFENFLVNQTLLGNQINSDIAMEADGDFVVAWQSPDIGGDGIVIQRFNAVGGKLGIEVTVNASPASLQRNPAVAMDSDGDFVVAWESNNQDTDADWGIRTRRYGEGDDSGDTVGPTVTGLYAPGRTDHALDAFERVTQPVTSLTVAFSEEMDATVTNVANWQLFRQGVDVSDQITNVAFALNAQTRRFEAVLSLSSPLVSGDYRLVARSTLTDTVWNQLHRLADGSGFGGDVSLTFTVAAPVAVPVPIPPPTVGTSVNTVTLNEQVRPSVAVAGDGSYVVVWQSFGEDFGATAGIFAQRYTAAGAKDGAPVLVNAIVVGDQVAPSVAINARGDFIVGWQGPAGIYYNIFFAAGGSTGELFVAFSVAGDSAPSVGIDALGNSVISFQGVDGFGDGILHSRIDPTGVIVGSAFVTFTAFNQTGAALAMAPNGDYLVVWQSLNEDLSGAGIYAQRFSALGVPDPTGQFRVNTITAGDQTAPTVAVDRDGNFVIAWQGPDADGNGIYARRYRADGTALDAVEFAVNLTTTGEQSAPSVTSDGFGTFTIVWQSPDGAASGDGIFARRYNPLGIALEPLEFQVNSTVAGIQSAPAVSANAVGDFVVAWQEPDGNGDGIFHRRYSRLATVTAVDVPGLLSTLGDNAVVLQSVSDLTVRFATPMLPANAEDRNNWEVTVNGAIASLASVVLSADGLVATLTLTTPITAPATVVVTAEGTLLDADSRALDGDLDGVAGGAFSRTFYIKPIVGGPEGSVTPTADAPQITPSVAVDPAGNYVVVWRSADGAGNGEGIFARRFNAAGVAQGAAFQVNVTSAGDQTLPVVGMDAAGNFVVAWQSFNQEGNGTLGIFARRFAADGTPLDVADFQVNTSIVGDQKDPTLAVDASGDFVIAWHGAGNVAEGIYHRRFNAMGQPRDVAEVFVAGVFIANQASPSVSMANNGDYVIAWQTLFDGDGSGINAQRYNAAGVAQGVAITVNGIFGDPSTVGDQKTPVVALDAAGQFFVVTWQSPDTSGDGIFARRFDFGVGLSLDVTPFRVNTTVANSQTAPTVGIDANGDFVVVWQGFGAGAGESDQGIYFQRFNANGEFQGGEELVNQTTTGNQLAPAVARTPTGDFVVAWQNPSTPSDQIFTRQFLANLPPTTTDLAPVNDLEDAANRDVNLAAAFNDPEQASTTLTYTVTANTNAALVTTSITGSTLTLDYLANGNGTADITVRATDNAGLFIDSTFTVTVTAVNDAPSGTNTTVTTSVSAAYTFTAADFGFTDADDTPADALFAVRITTLPAVGSLTNNGVAVVAGNFITLADITTGNLRFTPVAGESGSPYTTFTFQVQDDGGTANSGVDLDPTANTITVDVTGVNDAPSGTNDTVTTLEDTAYTFTAADFGFTDPNDTPANALLAVRITTLPALGTLTHIGVAVVAGDFISAADIAGGLLQYTPVAGESGAAYTTFTFQVQDDGGTAGGGVNLDPTANTITIDVTAVNDAPSGTNNTVTTSVSAAYTFTAADFGFTDPNDTPANALLAVRITTLPAVGSLTNNGVAVVAGNFITLADITAGNLRFTPVAGESGAAYTTFTFQVQDDGGTANSGVNLDPTANTITVDVTGVNEAPSGTNDTVTTLEDTAYTFTAADFGFTDPNDTPANALLAVRITTLPGLGSLTNNGVAVVAGTFVSAADIAGGLLRFTPTPNGFGAPYTTFTFQVQDDGGTVGGGVDLDPTANTITINVTPVNDAPVLNTTPSPTLDVVTPSDTDSRASAAVADLLGTAVTDAEPGDPEGMAVVGLATGAGGTWQYSTDSGTTWQDFGAVTAASARLLTSTNRVRFLPGASYAGGASITFRAWDQTTGTPGGTANLSAPANTGGSTAFSTATETATVNEGPVMLHGTTVSVSSGTAPDTLEFTAGASHKIELNDVVYTFSAVVAQNFSFDGQAGSDLIRVTGTNGVDEADISYLTGTLAGTGYDVTWTNFETVYVYSGGGVDTAKLNDTADNDVFQSRPEYAYMLSGSAYINWAVGFSKDVFAYSNTGGTDYAYLFDSAGNDSYGVSTAYGYMQNANGPVDWAVGFDNVYGYSMFGGKDTAYLYDSAGNDVFQASAAYAYLQGTTFINWAVNFASAYGYSSAGGTDQAYLFDSAGNDVFQGSAAYAYMQGTTSFNWAVGFRSVTALALSGGADQAYLFDTPGDDVFVGSGDVGTLTEATGQTLTASSFEEVFAYGISGGTNTSSLGVVAYLYHEIGSWI